MYSSDVNSVTGSREYCRSHSMNRFQDHYEGLGRKEEVINASMTNDLLFETVIRRLCPFRHSVPCCIGFYPGPICHIAGHWSSLISCRFVAYCLGAMLAVANVVSSRRVLAVLRRRKEHETKKEENVLDQTLGLSFKFPYFWGVENTCRSCRSEKRKYGRIFIFRGPQVLASQVFLSFWERALATILANVSMRRLGPSHWYISQNYICQSWNNRVWEDRLLQDNTFQ